MGNRQLVKLADLSFLYFTVILKPPDFFEMTTSGLECGKSSAGSSQTRGTG